jgi:hypothetical protein
MISPFPLQSCLLGDWISFLTVIRYNTAVFSTRSANGYAYIVVSEDFLGSSAIYNASSNSVLRVLDTMHELAVKGSLVNYTSTACMDVYGVNFVSTARNVLLVTEDATTANNSVFSSHDWDGYNEIPYWWICGDTWDSDPYTYKTAVCKPSIAKAAASTWTFNGHRINYCMVEVVEEQCRLSFSFVIMLVVIGVNASKACISTYSRLVSSSMSSRDAHRPKCVTSSLRFQRNSRAD